MKIAWVTGGGTGIGRALASALYAQGTKVVISGRRPEKLQEAVREISAGAGPGEILAIAGNVYDVAHIKHVVESVSEKWGSIDLLINNAGSNDNTSFKRATSEHFENAFMNNCLSIIRVVQAVLPTMLVAQSGTIINISSIYGRITSPTSASYTVSKHALAGYTDVLRQAVRSSGIHVMGVYPGYIRTDMTQPFVREGSLRAFVGKSPDAIAAAILRAVRRKKRDLYYPWYVRGVLRCYQWFPVLMDSLSARVRP